MFESITADVIAERIPELTLEERVAVLDMFRISGQLFESCRRLGVGGFLKVFDVLPVRIPMSREQLGVLVARFLQTGTVDLKAAGIEGVLVQTQMAPPEPKTVN